MGFPFGFLSTKKHPCCFGVLFVFFFFWGLAERKTVSGGGRGVSISTHTSAEFGELGEYKCLESWNPIETSGILFSTTMHASD